MSATPVPPHPPGPRDPTARLTLAALGAALVLGMAYIAYGTPASRAEALPSVLCELAVCVGLVAVAALRSPGGVLRISDPYLMFLGLGLNFLVVPSIGWLHGADYERIWFEAGRIRPDIFVRLQWLHVIFLVAFGAVYFAMAPPRATGAGPDPTRPLPSPWPWIAFGLLPLAMTVGERVITTGSLAAAQNYGEVWFREQETLRSTHAEGGSALAATQILGKVWFLPWQALGIGEGLLLARLIRERRRVAILLFALQLPLFTLLHAGGRSMIAIPFISALVLADLFAGPIRWRWLLAVAVLALTFFNIFGVYRAYRDRDFNQALEMTSEQYRSADRVEGAAEGDVTVVKEHYAVAWTDANDYSRGTSYFTESVLGLLPQQIVPEKVGYMNTALFLSRELLGSAATNGAGVAGSIIVDGYMMGREVGVLILAAVLGLIAGGVTRALSAGRPSEGFRPRLWKSVLMLSTPALGVVFFRNDLNAVISQTLTTVVMPAGFFALAATLNPASPWARPIDDM